MQTWLKLSGLLPESVGAKAKHLSEIIQRGIPVPAGIVIPITLQLGDAQLHTAVHGLCFPLIVRSSTNTEDGLDYSFAGVFHSEIVYERAKLASAVQSVRDSPRLPTATRLLAIYNIVPDDVQVSCIIQEYRHSVRGGVMITPKRMTGHLIVEAGSTAEAVTAGTRVPDRYDIDLQNVSVDIEPWQGQLIVIAHSLIGLYGEPQDVEWVETTEGVIEVIQSRPYVEKPENSDVLKTEIKRLQRTVDIHPGMYVTDTLPDIPQPTPITLSLMQNIYGAGLQARYAPIGVIDVQQIVPVIATQMYLDVAAINRTLFKGTIMQMESTPSGVAIKYRLRMIHRIFIRPLFHSRYVLQHLMAWCRIIRQKQYMNSQFSVPYEADESMLIAHIETKITPAMFRMTYDIQLLRSVLQKKLRIDDADDLLADLSLTPLQKSTPDSTDQQLVAQYGYYCGNEYELSAARLESIPQAARQLRILAKVDKTKRRAIRQQRLQAYKTFISVFDVIYLKNVYKLYDQLQQQRADLHDALVKTFAQLHGELLRLDHDNRLYGAIWYATIDEIRSHKLPSAQQLRKRADRWRVLQRMPLPSVNELTRWDQLQPVTTEKDQCLVFQGVPLSPGFARGTVVTSLEGTKKQTPHILVVPALSHDVIIHAGNISGVITERGGSLSHVSILAREQNLPIICLQDAMTLLKAGDELSFDAGDAEVHVEFRS